MAKEYGLKLGNLFIGASTGSTKSILQPFDTSDEGDGSHNPQVFTADNFEDLMSAVTGGYSAKNLIELFSTVPEIFAPVDAWASRVALGNFGFRKRSNKEKIEDNEVLNSILNSPNPMQSLRELIYEYVCYHKVTGENYIYSPTPKSMKRMDYKNMLATWNLPSDQTKPKTNSKLKLFSSRKKIRCHHRI